MHKQLHSSWLGFQKLPAEQKTWGLPSCSCLNPQFKVDFKSLLPLTAPQLSYFQRPIATHTVDGFPDTQALGTTGLHIHHIQHRLPDLSLQI